MIFYQRFISLQHNTQYNKLSTKICMETSLVFRSDFKKGNHRLLAVFEIYILGQPKSKTEMSLLLFYSSGKRFRNLKPTLPVWQVFIRPRIFLNRVNDEACLNPQMTRLLSMRSIHVIYIHRLISPQYGSGPVAAREHHITLRVENSPPEEWGLRDGERRIRGER